MSSSWLPPPLTPPPFRERGTMLSVHGVPASIRNVRSALPVALRRTSRLGPLPARGRVAEGREGAARASANITTRADFSAIRYAQSWEDADVLLAGLEVQPGDSCLSIASAGDNTLALLAQSPRHVLAIDV